jgi:hypothetical protein
LFAGVGPAIGWVAVKHNFENAVFSFGIFLVLSLFISALFFLKFDKNEISH